MDPGPCEAPSSLESGLPLSEPPCLIVEDSQPDSIGIEDDPENSYRALLTKRLTTLQPREPSPVTKRLTTLPARDPSPVLELISSPVGSRSSQSSSQSQPPAPEMNPSFEESESLDVSDKRMDSRGESQCLTHEESQFGFLELSQSQDLESELVQNRTGSRPGTAPSRPGPQVSVDVLLHSQNLSQNQNQEMLSSQEDLFDKTGAASDPVVPSCTPSRSLALLHLSGGVQGTLVNNSLSQGSVDFVAPTPDDFTPMIVPSSPTELPLADEPMDTSAPPTGPASSTPVSQNTPGFEPERPLSVPSQPDFSHDVFAPTQSQGSSSQTLRAAPAAFSQSSLNLHINTEPQDDEDEEATQIEQTQEETSPLNSATNSQNAQTSSQGAGSLGVADQAGKLAAGSQNSLRTSSQEVRARTERPKQGPNSNRNSQECIAMNVNNANGGNKLSQGSAKANSQPTGSVTGMIVNEVVAFGASQGKLMSQGSAKASSQSAGSAQEAVARSQTNVLNVEREKNARNFSQGSVKANSQPTGSVQGAVAGSQANILNVDHDKQARSLSQGSAKANSQPTGSVTGKNVNEKVALSASQPTRMSQGSAKANSQPARSAQAAVAGPQANILTVDHEKQASSLSQGSVKANSQPAGSVTDVVVENKAVLGASQVKVSNVHHEKMSQGRAKANSQPTGSVTGMTVSEKVALSASQPTRMSHGSAKANSQPAGSVAEVVRTSVNVNSEVQSASGGGAAASGSEREASLGLGLSQSEMLSPGNGADGGGGKVAVDGKGEVSGAKSLDSSGEISFHFTLPKEGELIGPSVGATPPQLGQLKKSVRHSTPIELHSLSQSSAVSAAGSDIVAEAESEGADGKLSLRMKLVTPVEEGSSERFSLQRPSLTEEDQAGPKSTVKNSHSSPSVFSRVRQVHRQQQDDSALRSPLFTSTQRTTESNSLPNSQSDASKQDATSRLHASAANESREKNPSHHAPGAANSHDKTDTETPPSRRAGPAHRRHVRTIQEVRTTVTRIITDVYYEDGKEVDRTVTQESDEPVVQFQVMDVSPSRTGSSSVTSGDLADISSSTCTTGTGSSSGTGTTDRPEFLPPPSRGAKTNSAPPAGPDSLAPLLDSSSGPQSGSSFVGLRVVAKWSSNGYFYSGRIIEDRGVQAGRTESGGPGPDENRFRLRFDDGYECELWARDILLCDPIPLETEVTALNPDQTYTSGVVKAHRMEGSELQYCVERGEQRVWFSRGSVILSLDQGNRLREHHSLGPYHPPTGLGKASDISLDNLVEGKRKRRAGQSGLNTPTRSPRVRTKPSSSPGPGSEQSPGPSPGPSPGSKRKLGSDRTPAAKRGRRAAGKLDF